jgi:tetratricopeptide (TPR) repeat protein
MKPLSDWQATVHLMENGTQGLAPLIVYKACSAFASNGQSHEAEALLETPYRRLLEARRKMKSGQWEDAHSILVSDLGLNDAHENYFELQGDRHYILGNLAHRQNQPGAAEAQFKTAAQFYKQGRDQHRLLRCLINEKICRSSLTSHVSGELFFLKQKAFNEEFWDLVGNIEKAAVPRWLAVGSFAEALQASQRALEAYRRDGCPEDRAVAQALNAICLCLTGDKPEAARIENTIAIRDGKVATYLNIIRSLLNGQIPLVDPDHSLADAMWETELGPKRNSIPGRILECLSQQAMERDELIRVIWGETATDPSYCSRLYTAIRDLRRKYQISVEFDGRQYRLVS